MQCHIINMKISNIYSLPMFACSLQDCFKQQVICAIPNMMYEVDRGKVYAMTYKQKNLFLKNSHLHGGHDLTKITFTLSPLAAEICSFLEW